MTSLSQSASSVAIAKRAREVIDWVDARSVRERVLLLVSALAVLYALAASVLMPPLRKAQGEVEGGLQRAQEQMRALEAQKQAIVEAASRDPNVELRRRITDFQRQIEALDGLIEKRTVSMISPTEMAHLLERMLSEKTELRLIRLENLAPEAFLGDPAPVVEPTEVAAGLFKHGFVFELSGGYLGTLHFLRVLEELPWNFFWESFEYVVQEYPEARIVIRAYTLSAEEGWVGA